MREVSFFSSFISSVYTIQCLLSSRSENFTILSFCHQYISTGGRCCQSFDFYYSLALTITWSQRSWSRAEVNTGWPAVYELPFTLSALAFKTFTFRFDFTRLNGFCECKIFAVSLKNVLFYVLREIESSRSICSPLRKSVSTSFCCKWATMKMESNWMFHYPSPSPWKVNRMCFIISLLWGTKIERSLHINF